MGTSRRQVLSFGTALSVASVSGCAGLFSAPSYLTVVFLNFHERLHHLDIEIFRADADEYRDALVLSKRYQLQAPPEGDAAYEHVEEDILESDKYVVQVYLETAPTVRGTYHFYPALEGDAERDDRLFVEIHTESGGSEPYVAFQQDH